MGQPASQKRHLALYSCFIAAGLLTAFRPTLFSGFRLMQTDPGDTRLVNFILEYEYRWFTGWLTFHPINLWDQPIFYPVRNTGAYTEILLAASPIYWFFRAIRFGPETSFQLWMMAVVVLDFAAMAVFLRRCLGFGPWASSVGAFLFAFASPRIVQLGHQQLLPQFFTILALYGLFRSFRPGRMTSEQGLYLFFVAFAAQLWSGFYLGWFLFFGLVVAGIWALCLPRYRKPSLEYLARHRRTLVRGTGLLVVLVAPMVVHYVLARRAVGGRPWWDASQMLPPFQSWLYLGPQSWLYSWQPTLHIFQRISMEHEQRLGIGWVTLPLAVVGFHRFARMAGGWARVVGLTAVTVILLATLFPGGITAWKPLFYAVPGASAVRAVSRMGLLVLIPLSVGLAYLVETRSRVVVLAIAIVCVLEQVQTTGAFSKLQSMADVSSLAGRLKKDCVAFFYAPVYDRDGPEVPFSYQLQVDAMWAALQSGVPTINGYSGNQPKGWSDFSDNRAFVGPAQSRIRDALHRWVKYYRLDPQRVCWIDSR